jgi:hypothetical protein
MSADSKSELPRLAYIGDVPIEETTGGSNMLYRLLATYPPERLLVIESDYAKKFSNVPERRLQNVQYANFHLADTRYLNSRIRGMATLWLLAQSLHRKKHLKQLLANFAPEAFITVGFGFSWLLAYTAARAARADFHFLVCDDFASLIPSGRMGRFFADRLFGQAYRHATSRLCLTPDIDRVFTARYGAAGTTLWIPRPANCESYFAPSPRLLAFQQGPLVFAYVGTVWDRAQIAVLAAELKAFGGKLLLFCSGQTAEQLAQQYDNVIQRPLLPTGELIATLRQEADVLFASLSFDPAARANAEVCFPSKLVDYTATGLPILIWAPEYSSAVKWARLYPGVAYVISEPDDAVFCRALQAINVDCNMREQIATTALKVGNRLFDHKNVVKRLHQVIAKAIPQAI